MKKIFLRLLTTSILMSTSFAAETPQLDTHGETPHTKLSDAVTAKFKTLKAKFTIRDNPMFIDGLRKVLDEERDPNKFLPYSFWTPASFAASHGMLETLKALAQMGAQLVTTQAQTASPSHTAVELFSTDQVAELVVLAQEQKFDINSQDSSGRTLLYCALDNKDPETATLMVRWLIKSGARTDVTTTISTQNFRPLGHALSQPTLKDHEPIIELLTKGLTPEQITAEQQKEEESMRNFEANQFANEELSAALSFFEENIDNEAVGI
ncbi:MAG: hypothetical protein H6492_02340 [Candidatus Paracaedibacteraceae bacterium]|nr:hypothetical protein [Candidatus Paracaedibacteraceae bacterium]